MTRKALFLVAFTALASVSSAQVTLRLNLQPGKTYTYVLETKMSQSMMGDMNQRLTQAMKVDSKKGDKYSITTTIKDVKIDAKQGSMLANQAKQMEQTMKNMKIQASYNSLGKSVGGATTASSPAARNMAGGLAGLNAGFLGMTFPTGPVKAGSTWTETIDLQKMMSEMGGGAMPQGMKISGKPILVKYTVKSIGTQGGKQVVNIGYTINGTLQMNMAGGQQQISFNIGMNGSGASVVDAATGLQLSNTSSTKMTFAGQGMPQGMDQTMTSKMTLK